MQPAPAACVALIALSLFTCAPAVRAGQPNLMIHHRDDEPITIEAGEFSAADPEWLKTLSLTIRNSSDHPIYDMEFEVTLSGLSGEHAVYPLRFGDPDILKTNRASKDDKAVNPNKTVKVRWDGDAYKHLKQTLADAGVHYPAAAIIKLVAVSYGDGSGWNTSR